MSDAFTDRYGPVALVTGASSGIGRSFAALLAAKGLDLVVVARRAQRLDELALRLQRLHGVKVTVCQADLADDAAARQILETTSALDIGLLGSNAGFGYKGPFDEYDAEAMSDMLDVNCRTPMLLARGFVPRLRRRGKGGVVFTSSIEGLMGCPYSAVYAATKGFMNSFGEALWAELTPEGISVLTLCPGATDTEVAQLQSIDPATLQAVMSSDDVAELTLENLDKGPVYIPSAYYKAMFEQLLAMPRGDALMTLAKALKQ